MRVEEALDPDGGGVEVLVGDLDECVGEIMEEGGGVEGEAGGVVENGNGAGGFGGGIRGAGVVLSADAEDYSGEFELWIGVGEFVVFDCEVRRPS